MVKKITHVESDMPYKSKKKHTHTQDGTNNYKVCSNGFDVV